MAVNSYDCDYNKPYSPVSLEHGNEMDTSTYIPSPVQQCSASTATSSSTIVEPQFNGRFGDERPSSAIVIDLDDGGDAVDLSSRSNSPSIKASSQTEVMLI